MINLLSSFNIVLALISAIPCLMAGAMSMDSPQAQNSILAHAVAYLVLSFPLVSLICGIIPLLFTNRWAIFIAAFPVITVSLFFLVLYTLAYLQS